MWKSVFSAEKVFANKKYQETNIIVYFAPGVTKIIVISSFSLHLKKTLNKFLVLGSARCFFKMVIKF